MPIYTDINNWKLVPSLRQGEILMFRDVIKKAMKDSKFDYRTDKDFLTSFSANSEYNEPYIYSYDISNSLLDRGQYAKELEDLIKVANYHLSQSKKWYNKYKFDILGSYTVGKIIVLIRYDLTEKEKKDIEKKKTKTIKKFYKGIYINLLKQK